MVMKECIQVVRIGGYGRDAMPVEEGRVVEGCRIDSSGGVGSIHLHFDRHGHEHTFLM